MKKGKACTVNLLYVIPLFGDGSIIRAAEKGKVNNVELIGETGWWYFPFCTVCTVVYGDKSAINERPETTPQGDNSTIKEKPEKTTLKDGESAKLKDIEPPAFF